MTLSPVEPATTVPRRPGAGRALLVVYVVVSAADIVAEAVGARGLTWVTKPLIVPLLLAWLLVTATRPLRPPLRLMAAGLVAAWLGDLALMLDGDLPFLAGIACFLMMQLCYLAAFRRVSGPGLVRAWPVALVPYVLVWVALAVAMRNDAGALYLPALIYGLVLVAMAVAALDLVLRVPRRPGARVAIGALFFLASDAMLALTAFAGVTSTRATDVAVMLTYVVAQALIVTGFVTAVEELPADRTA